MPSRNFYISILATFLALNSAPLFAEMETLTEVNSEVYLTAGTVMDISKKAKSCMGQILHNDEVRIADSSAGTGFLSFAEPGRGNHSSGITGGQIIIDADLEGGMITANNRADYGSRFIQRNVKSTVVFQAKEGRFKIDHTNIEVLMKDTGGGHNKGYGPAFKIFATGWEDAEATLKNISDKLAACIKDAKINNW